MPLLKTTSYIFNHPWSTAIENLADNPGISSVTTQKTWTANNSISINDVVLWEQIYYDSGQIGIYAAWDPYEEFYLIVHNLFINTNFGVEIFSGIEAANDVWNRATELGVDLVLPKLAPLK